MPVNDSSPEYSTTEIAAEEVIRLLEERLIIDRSKRKVGEVIIRKVVETQIVEVPVRREKLIVEQISPECKQLAAIDLGQGDVTGVELTQVASPDSRGVSQSTPTVSGDFTSPKAASLVLDSIVQQHRHGCLKVRIEIAPADPDYQATYQEWFDRCSGSMPLTSS